MDKQIAGLPTNVGFLQELAGHSAFEKGLVDTHFIERYQNDLLSTSTQALSGSHEAEELGAILAAACICKKDHVSSEVSLHDKKLSMWYAHPPFRMHHFAKRLMEFELDRELGGSSDDLLKLSVTYRSDGTYFVETEDGSSPGLDVKVDSRGDHDFRVDVGGLQTDVTLAFYSKVNLILHYGGSEHIHQLLLTVIPSLNFFPLLLSGQLQPYTHLAWEASSSLQADVES
jgi:3-methylcrotonyl-CoA carboxylase alpha subunit